MNAKAQYSVWLSNAGMKFVSGGVWGKAVEWNVDLGCPSLASFFDRVEFEPFLKHCTRKMCLVPTFLFELQYTTRNPETATVMFNAGFSTVTLCRPVFSAGLEHAVRQ